MGNKKLIGAVAVAGTLLVGGSSAFAFAGDDSSGDVRQVRQSAAQVQDRDDDLTREELDRERAERESSDRDLGMTREELDRERRGGPGPEDCTTQDPAVDAKRAERIALQEVPGAQVTAIDLDRCYGPEWEVELRDGAVEHEIEINANTGQIVSAEQEEDD